MQMNVVLDLVLDFVRKPEEFVKLCVTSKAIYMKRQAELSALAATRPASHTVHVDSWRFHSNMMSAIRHIARFYTDVHHVHFYIDISQTVKTTTTRFLHPSRRADLRQLVGFFYDQSPNMRRLDSTFSLEMSSHVKDKAQWETCWSWMTDADMVIFDKCTNLHLSFPDQITDDGLMSLHGCRYLFVSHSCRMAGHAFLKLYEFHNLNILIITGRADHAGYDVEALTAIQVPRKYLAVTCQLCL